MEYITLRNGMKMPKLGLGTYQSGGDDCFNSVIWALEAGYKLIDTAQLYENEKIVGDAIKASKIDRKDLTLVTKISYKSYHEARSVVENSLRNLNTDYLDAVLLHWPYNDYYTAWRELEKLYFEGKIRAIGVSNFEPDRLVDISLYNEVTPFINQIETNLFCQRKFEREWMDRYGIAHMAYTPLGQGRRNDVFELKDVKTLSEKYGKTPAQIVLRFLTQLNIVAIPKSVHKNRVQENFDIFDFELSEQEMTRLKALDTMSPIIGTPSSPLRCERMAFPHPNKRDF